MTHREQQKTIDTCLNNAGPGLTARFHCGTDDTDPEWQFLRDDKDTGYSIQISHDEENGDAVAILNFFNESEDAMTSWPSRPIARFTEVVRDASRFL